MPQSLAPSLVKTERDIWIEVATAFATLSIDCAIEHLLEKPGTLCNVDYAFHLRYDYVRSCYTMAHEWSAEGIPGNIQIAQGRPIRELSWGLHRLQQGDIICIEDINDMPVEAVGLQEEIKRYKIASVLMVPVLVNGISAGTLGFATKFTLRKWSAHDIEILRSSCRILGRILEQRNSPVFFLNRSERMRRVQGLEDETPVIFDDIRRIESDRNYTHAILKNGRRRTELRPLSDWIMVLPREVFVRVHRSHLVNVAYIERVNKTHSGWALNLVGETADIPVGRSFRKVLETFLKKFSTISA